MPSLRRRLLTVIRLPTMDALRVPPPSRPHPTPPLVWPATFSLLSPPSVRSARSGPLLCIRVKQSHRFVLWAEPLSSAGGSPAPDQQRALRAGDVHLSPCLLVRRKSQRWAWRNRRTAQRPRWCPIGCQSRPASPPFPPGCRNPGRCGSIFRFRRADPRRRQKVGAQAATKRAGCVGDPRAQIA